MKCRACRSKHLSGVVDLGAHQLGGFFPETGDTCGSSAQLSLMYCHSCTLVQLEENGVDVENLYGPHYGYRSGLNQSMIDHLRDISKMATRWIGSQYSPWVLDIGSNDGTLLRQYGSGYRRVGCDPNISKWAQYYDPGIIKVDRFFSGDAIRETCGDIKFQIISSIACFYDVEDPIAFAASVFGLLEDNGVWLIEVQDIQSMLDVNAFDTICHEHLCYFSTRSLAYVVEKAGFKIIDHKHTDTNGGSIVMVCAKKNSFRPRLHMLHTDRDWELSALHKFQHQIDKRVQQLAQMLLQIKERGGKIYGLGASTKGNTLLQVVQDYMTFPIKEIITAIGEVNPDKFGRMTPGTSIPIVPEAEVVEKADYLLVLPWHFRENLSKSMMPFMENGGKLIFPLPEVEEVDAKSAHNWGHRPRRLLPY